MPANARAPFLREFCIRREILRKLASGAPLREVADGRRHAFGGK